MGKMTIVALILESRWAPSWHQPSAPRLALGLDLVKKPLGNSLDQGHPHPQPAGLK